MFIALKPLNERPGHVSADQVVNGLRESSPASPAPGSFSRPSRTSRSAAVAAQRSTSTRSLTKISNELNTWAPRLQARMTHHARAHATSPPTSRTRASPQTLVIDRDTASRLGISASAIDQVLYDAFGQREVSTMYTGLNQYYVVMEVDPHYQLSPDSLNSIYIKASTTTGASPSVPTLGTTTPAAATNTGASLATSAPASAPGGTPAVFSTSGGILVTSAANSSTISTTPDASSTSPVAGQYRGHRRR